MRFLDDLENSQDYEHTDAEEEGEDVLNESVIEKKEPAKKVDFAKVIHSFTRLQALWRGKLARRYYELLKEKAHKVLYAHGKRYNGNYIQVRIVEKYQKKKPKHSEEKENENENEKDEEKENENEIPHEDKKKDIKPKKEPTSKFYLSLYSVEKGASFMPLELPYVLVSFLEKYPERVTEVVTFLWRAVTY